MSFSDDDLKRLKEMIADTNALWVNDKNIANPLLALLARLDAAEECMAACLGGLTTCVKEFSEWRKSAGKDK